jgi:hypothetical protein
MTVSRLYSLRSQQSYTTSLTSLTSSITSSLNNLSLNTEQTDTLDFNMSDTFYVTPVDELEKLEDWNNPLAFQAAHHHENLDVSDSIEVEWRLRDRV